MFQKLLGGAISEGFTSYSLEFQQTLKSLLLRTVLSSSKSSLNKTLKAAIMLRSCRTISARGALLDLIVTKRLSKNLDSYTQKVNQVIAAEQLLKEGVEVSAGKTVRFLFTSAKNKRYERGVRAEELIEEKTHSDVRRYLLLLYSAASNILSPFGYSAKDIYDAVRGYQRLKLTAF